MRLLDRFTRANILKNCMYITISMKSKVCLVTITRAQLLGAGSYVEALHIGALI